MTQQAMRLPRRAASRRGTRFSGARIGVFHLLNPVDYVEETPPDAVLEDVDPPLPAVLGRKVERRPMGHPILRQNRHLRFGSLGLGHGLRIARRAERVANIKTASSRDHCSAPVCGARFA